VTDVGCDTGNSLGTRGSLFVDGVEHTIHDLTVVARQFPRVATWPYAVRILLENLLRNEDGASIVSDDIVRMLEWDPQVDRDVATLFVPARVLLQDFTGVPTTVDLASLRDALVEGGGDPRLVTPRLPADLVMDHSVMVDVAGSADAARLNLEFEYRRNRERYRFLRWGAQAFEGFRVIPPGAGIVHQVNLEHLADVVHRSPDGQLYPDTLIGLDSHTPMINGIGVLGWGVGGIEAEAAMLGQPVSLLVPRVVGVRLIGRLAEGTTATDLVLTITERLRAHGVVGCIVEFHGEGLSAVTSENRATIGNMSPEYGSTATIFPVDAETLRYLRFTGRSEEQVRLVEGYMRAQGLFHDPERQLRYSSEIEIDLGSIVPCIAGPSRPQDRVPLTVSRERFRAAVAPYREAAPETVPVTLADGTTYELDHGHVALASITSCTNTSNPQVMIAAGLLAHRAQELGLQVKPWVRTSFAPGSRVVIDYLTDAGLMPALESLGFHLVGFGCATCAGNSGPLDEEVAAAVRSGDLAAVSVLSGNRNFEGRIHPLVRMNYLASPPLVVAYAIAGTMDIDLLTDPIGEDRNGRAVHLRDVWPSQEEIDRVVRASVRSDLFLTRYADIEAGDDLWEGLGPVDTAATPWDPTSTYIRPAPFWQAMDWDVPDPVDVIGARALLVLGDGVTTDHISPAGAIPADSPAGHWLVAQGVPPEEFNSYGARRGNHEVMARGGFANIRIRNLMLDSIEGGRTLKFPEAVETSVFEAAQRYRVESVPLVVLAGREYGTGSSRDWAAKAPRLLGVRAIIAESFERIHRSNLIGMGILPLQFRPEDSIASLGLTGHEVFDLVGISDATRVDRAQDGSQHPGRTLTVRADTTTFEVDVRIETPLEATYYRNGGILDFVLRELRQRSLSRR